MPVEALVTPEVMRWARETRGFDIEQAAKKIGRSAEEICGWEDGSQRPSMPQARKAAEAYKRPLAVFYLPEPPKGYEVLKDFRRLPNEYDRHFSPDLLMLIREASSRQEWLRDFLQNEGSGPLGFIGCARTSADSIAVAESIRAAIGLTHEDQQKSRTREDALNLWIEHVEAAGIFISRDSKVSCEEARGFALCDAYAPLIFINSKDAKSAQVFTLAHELAHLWIDVSGVSNLEHRGQWQIPQADSVEAFCNGVAGQLVLPRDSFSQMWSVLPKSTAIEERIESVAAKCKVSSEVVARRLLESQVISEEKYHELRDLYKARWLEYRDAESQARKEREDTPPLYYPLTAMRNGQTFTRLVLGAYFTGMISGREASSLLSVKVDKFGKLAHQVKVYTRASQGGSRS